MRLLLASGSPRRRDLLALLGLPFEVVAPDVDESVRPGETPVDLVRRLAIDKVEAVEAVEAVTAGATVAGIRETARAAISATRSSRESSSNGHTHEPNSWMAIPVVSPDLVARTSPPRAGNRTAASSAAVPAPITAAAIRWTAPELCWGLLPMGARVSMSAKSTSTTTAPT